MPPELQVEIAKILGTALVSIIGAWLVFKVNMKRTLSQNQKDDIESAANAVKLANDSVERINTQEHQIAALKAELGNMKVFMTFHRYRAVLEFDDGPALAQGEPLLRVARLERIREAAVQK